MLQWKVLERQKLIHFLQTKLIPAPSGKALRKALEANLCRVNGAVERFGSTSLSRGALVELALNWDEAESSKSKEHFVLYEDNDLLIVNKSAGWVCTDAECKKAFGPGRFLIHRLDKETTGALLIAKSVAMRDAMIEQFREKKVQKLYYAIVDGVPNAPKGVCQSLLAKVGQFEGQSLWGSAPRGQSAETHWKVLGRGAAAALLACQPITGRTHQIRVHLAEMGHPILIDRQYAKRYRSKYFAKRPLLHAARLSFVQPLTGVKLDVAAEVGEDFAEGLAALGLLQEFRARN